MDSTTSATATTFWGNVIPGRYLALTWVVLIISVSFLPSTCTLDQLPITARNASADLLLKHPNGNTFLKQIRVFLGVESGYPSDS